MNQSKNHSRGRAWTSAFLCATLSASTLAVTNAHEERATQDPLTVDEILEHVRAASGREAWGALPHGVAFEGTSTSGGVEATYALHLTGDGRYRYELDGPLGRTVTFDGDQVTLRVRRGPAQVLHLADRETWQLSQWVHSGFWAAKASPLEFALVDETEQAVTLRVEFPGSPASALLALDRSTWLPTSLERSILTQTTTVHFGEYEELAGIPFARVVESQNGGEGTVLEVLEARRAGPDPGTRFEQGDPAASDVTFDDDGSNAVEFRRVSTGHLIVHPRVEGRDVGWFILDSGAGQNCIDPVVADALELERFGSVPAVGVAGSVRTGYRQGRSLQLGPLQLEDPVYVELDLSFLAPVFGVDVAGICGYEVFSRAIVQVDIENTNLELFAPSTFELTGGDWSPMTLNHRVPAMNCRFEGNREGLFKIDLGDSSTITFYSPAVERLRLMEGRDVAASSVGGVGGSGRASSGSLEWFEVGDHRFEPLPVQFSHTEDGVFATAYALGNLGTRMLKPFVVVFDYSQSRIALLPRD